MRGCPSSTGLQQSGRSWHLIRGGAGPSGNEHIAHLHKEGAKRGGRTGLYRSGRRNFLDMLEKSGHGFLEIPGPVGWPLQSILVYVSDYHQTLLLSQVPGPRNLVQAIICACAGAYVSEGIVQPRALEHTVRFVHDLDRARNIGDISAQVLRHASEIGAEHVIAGTIPGAGPRRQQLSQALFGNWPAEWLNRYVSRGYVLKDSIILHAKSNGAPFFWDELDPIVEANPEARLIMREAREFNLVGGFTAAIPTLDGQTIGFSIGGRHFEIDPEKRGVLTLIACCAVGRAIALQQESSTKSKNVTLSPREREALQWAAEGKGDWEIGEVMNISEHGADKHLRSIRTKLGAINRTQAVAEAIRRGLIA